LLDEHGDIQEYKAYDFHYAYRDSKLKRLQPLQASLKPVILSANFRLNSGAQDEVNVRAEQFLQHRRGTQPVEPSLGSTFVNPSGDYAGRLIEAAGLKGARVGGAEVSQLHANFVINAGGVGACTAQDVIQLIHFIQETVERRFGIRLEPEVQLAGTWDDSETRQ
jgi:UDP-N-acetylmuramate dehydrogenase